MKADARVETDAFSGWDGGGFKVEEMEADDRVQRDAFSGWNGGGFKVEETDLPQLNKQTLVRRGRTVLSMHGYGTVLLSKGQNQTF